MKEQGIKPGTVEIGNAWKLHAPGSPTNWIIGRTPAIAETSLRYMRHNGPDGSGELAADLGVKWFVHDPSHPSEWGKKKPSSRGRTLPLLVGDGEFELTFEKDGVAPYQATLEESGDFVIWGEGLAHSWRPLKKSTVMTIRWLPME